MRVSEPRHRDRALGRQTGVSLRVVDSTAEKEGCQIERLQFGAWVEDGERGGTVDGLLVDCGDDLVGGGVGGDADCCEWLVEEPGVELLCRVVAVSEF